MIKVSRQASRAQTGQALVEFALILVPLLLILIGVAITMAGWPAIRTFGLGFITSSEWNVPAGKFGAAPGSRAKSFSFSR